MNSNLGNIRALKEYNRINLHTGVESASPHRLIQMLIDGALGKIAQAKGHINLQDTAQKGEAISMAVSIIGGLRDSLDHKKGGSIAENLDSLYEYMTYRLMEANLKDDITMLDEVYQLLSEIKTAWDGIQNHPDVVGHDNQERINPAA